VDLTRKFEESASNHATSISTLEISRKYLIVEIQYVGTKSGPTVLRSIKDKSYTTIKVFIHKEYSRVFLTFWYRNFTFKF